MKTVYAALSAVVLMVSANAALATTPVQKRPVIIMHTGGGMPAPGGIASIEVVVSNTGAVDVTEVRYPKMEDWGRAKPTTKQYALAFIQSPETMLSIQKLARTLKGGELVKDDPNAPDCADAPGTSFYVVKDETRVEVGGTLACNRYSLADKSQHAMANRVQDILQSLENLIAR